MMQRFIIRSILSTGLSLFLFSATAQLRLPRLISNNMILQRDQPVKLWGWAVPLQNVILRFREKTYSAKSDTDGHWQIILPPQPAGGPHQMVFESVNRIELNNVLFGDIWLCSGQSNMELWMDRLRYRYPAEVAGANNPFVRQFLVPDRYDFKKSWTDYEGGEWKSVSTATIGEFSGVGYFFAKEIYERYKIPVGLINAALGGSPAEAWISEASLKKFPDTWNEMQRFKNDQLIRDIEAHDRQISNAWYNYADRFDEGEWNRWQLPAADDRQWQSIQVPGYWADAGRENFNGVAWYRKEFRVPVTMTGKPVLLEMGRIVDADSVFVNGQFVGWTSYQYPPRRYPLSPGILKEGINHIVIRVVNNSGKGGMVPDKRYEITAGKDTIALTGEWKFRKGISTVSLPSQTFIRWKPGGLFNAMIAPMVNYTLKGVIWYQGESNTKDPGPYQNLMETLISDWRNQWQQPGLPFYFVQLANFMEPKSQPGESSWADLRDQQRKTLSVPGTGMAVAIDIGEWNDIHPEDKQTVAQRLARWARRDLYGEKKLMVSGPLYAGMKKIGNRIRISFSHIGTGLICKGDSLKYFSIAGSDKKFTWAHAIIKENTVEVWNDAIPDPVAVRYAWADNPEGCNLYNKEGLPASPFRTDQ